MAVSIAIATRMCRSMYHRKQRPTQVFRLSLQWILTQCQSPMLKIDFGSIRRNISSVRAGRHLIGRAPSPAPTRHLKIMGYHTGISGHPQYHVLRGCLSIWRFQICASRLRNSRGLTGKIKTLPEILGESGYQSLCVGFGGNPYARGCGELRRLHNATLLIRPIYCS